MTGRLPARCSADADEDILSQTTPVTKSQLVTVFYPFHPFHDLKLEVATVPRQGSGGVTVIVPSGDRLIIPRWMLSPVAASFTVSAQATVGRHAWLALLELLKDPIERLLSDNLPPESEKEGGRCETARTHRSVPRRTTLDPSSPAGARTGRRVDGASNDRNPARRNF